jgi:nuclear pore complex protein Nup62
MSQIIKILNAHLNSLEWIDQNSNQLQLKIQEISKTLSSIESSTSLRK